MEDLRAHLPNLRDDHPTISSSIREEREETCTHTPPVRITNDSSSAPHSHREAMAPWVMRPTPAMKIVNSIHRQIDALIKKVAGHT
ncbi:hypothetical protein LIER_35367 [Lithospermum erythrorhizon]|uniref:Uncharacterized protein n=1 Tax=Lithospermum erythrorhizon TaxID=34254 RepID=A0AAV3NN42_LITER